MNLRLRLFFRVPLFKELRSHLREHGTAQDVLFCFRNIAVVGLYYFQFGLKQISRTAGDDLVVSDRLLPDFLIDFSRKRAVFPAQKSL